MQEKTLELQDTAEKMDEEQLIKERILDLELQLNVERMKYRIIADNSNCGLWEYDIASKKYSQSRKLDGKYSNMNLDIENYRETIKGWGLIHPEDLGVFEAYCDSMDRGDAEFEYDLRAASDGARFIWLRYIGGAVYDLFKKPVKIVGKTLNVTKEKADLADMVKKSSQDPLTHLYNKTVTKQMIEGVLKKHTSGQSDVLYIIDIDNFKEINERFGHLYGDSVLERFADSLLAFFRPEDVVGRIGGDEFLVLCRNVTNEEKANHIADKFKYRALGLDLKEGENLSVSIGIAMFPKHAKTFEALYKSADIALYHAKNSGKNCCSLYNKHMVHENNIGETDRKKVSNQIVNSTSKEMINIEKELFDYSFETICQSENFKEALLMILTEIGIYFNLDTILVLEYNPVMEKANLLGSWSKEAISKIEEIYTRYWGEVENYFYQENSLIYDTTKTIKVGSRIHTIFKERRAQAVLQFPIFDGNQLVGMLSFEDNKGDREWNISQIATLSSITKMISSYMLRLRSKTELEEEILYTGSAMDNQKLTYYSINAKTYELVYVSRYATELFPKIKLGEKCYKSIMGYHSPCKNCPILSIKNKETQHAIESYNEAKDKWFTVSASAIPNTVENPQYLICWMDITMFLERVKSTDQLTGTLAYDKFRADALKQLTSNAYNNSYATAFIGIRNFSDVNDHYGYTVGDYVLQALANKFMESLSQDEIICRIKGDDFVLLLKNDGIQLVKNRIAMICKSFHMQLRDKYPYMALRCDCGVYEIKPCDYSISSILDKTNLARKKAMGYCHEWDSITILTEEYERQENEEKMLERLMVEALHKNEYQVYLQPKVDVKTGLMAGAEALVRWIREDNQVIASDIFIPLAEKIGFVTEIDKYVYEMLFRQMHKWIQEGYELPMISFNVSRLHLFDDNFVEYLKKLVERYEIPYKLLEIEITETVFFDNIDRLIDMIARLRYLGFTISMDDFGTGYSTLNLMKSLPIDILKIDGKFFYKNHLDPKSKAVISSIIHLAKNLGLKVVAEGIETLEQVIYIQEEDCDYAQGFYYYKPLALKDFIELLKI